MSAGSSLARAVEAATQKIGTSDDLQTTLNTIAVMASVQIPEAAQVGIWVAHANGWIETRAATVLHPVESLDASQTQLGEGPCVRQGHSQGVQVVHSFAGDPRWPRYSAVAAAAGLPAQLSVGADVDRRTTGGLTVYLAPATKLRANSSAITGLLATYAAMALGRAHSEAKMQAALDHRRMIGQAIGILMERHHDTEAEAFEKLRLAARSGRTKLVVEAEKLVATCSADA